MQTIISIPGMHCAGCEALVKDVSSEFPTLKSVTVDLKTKKVSIEHDADFDVESWKKAINELGPEYKIKE